MTLVEQIQRQISQLPPEKQSEVLDFVTFWDGSTGCELKGDI